MTMPRVIIDNQEVEVTLGSNLLAAARKLGLDIPALCYHPACEPNTACMACLMRLHDPDRIVPACATTAEEGMIVESETEEMRGLRRVALELLLSDHCGDEVEAVSPEQAAVYPNCACAKKDVCRLRKYARMYDADPTRFRGQQRPPQRPHEHPENPQVTVYLDRLFKNPDADPPSDAHLRVVVTIDDAYEVPLGQSLDKALQKAARRCAGACPTGALARRGR